MHREHLISRRDKWLSASVGDQLVMMNADSSVYINLTGTGGHIWKLLETPRSLNELCRCLADAYDAAPEQIDQEVQAFLARLKEHNAIEIAAMDDA
jgi:hypothetical protein